MKEIEWLAELMSAQKEFEEGLRGTDGTLAEFNSPEFILTRGIKGEADECLEALQAGQFAEAKYEAVDVLIFLASLFNHMGLQSEDVQRMARVKMQHNFSKYKQEHFEGRTVREGVIYARQQYANRGEP